MPGTPVLYSFRRCPYCIRAHMALKNTGLKIELREVKLGDFPEQALKVSPKATVPILVLPDNTIIDESWDIVKWALIQNDPDNWLGENSRFLPGAEMLVETNDFSFKNDLDHYKYSDRYPEHSQLYYRQSCEIFIEELEGMLRVNNFLLDEQLSLADISVFPFIRQFSLVDKNWFDKSHYEKVKKWLDDLVGSDIFQSAFQKQGIWKPDGSAIYI